MNKGSQLNAEDLNAILGDIQGGIILCNYNLETMTSEIVYANRGWTDITGYTIEQLNAEKDGIPQALVYAEDKKIMDEEYMRQRNQSGSYELLYRIVHRSGKVRWVIDKGVTTTLPDGRLQNKSIITEVTEIKEREEHMAALAQTDQLTGLNNKVTFTLLATTILKQRNRNLNALLILDIDNFKDINDTRGHDFGDKVLAEMGVQLKRFFRTGDILGRIGGDEFMVLMRDVSSEEMVVKKVQLLRTAIPKLEISEQAHKPVTISVGISCSVGGKTYETMFSEADTALYSAKNNGKNQHCIWRQHKPIV